MGFGQRAFWLSCGVLLGCDGGAGVPTLDGSAESDSAPVGSAGEGGASLSAIPDQEFQQVSESDWAFNEAIGMTASRRHLIVQVDPEIPSETLTDIVGTSGGSLGGTIPWAGILQIVFSEGTEMATLQDAFDRLESNEAVQNVIHERPDAPTVAHPDRTIEATGFFWDYTEEGTGIWGLAEIRAPQAWNVVDAIADSAPTIEVLQYDTGWFPHPDLAGVVDAPVCGPCSMDHATFVAGIMGARWPGNLFVEGVSPFIHISGFEQGHSSRLFDALKSLPSIPASTRTRIVNYSIGNNWDIQCFGPEGRQRRCDPRDTNRVSDGDGCTPERAQAVVGREAEMFEETVALLAEAHNIDVLFVSAAGNESGDRADADSDPNNDDYCAAVRSGTTPLPPTALGDFPAEYGSGMNWAARHGGAASYTIVVEALSPFGPTGPSRASYSNVNGSVFAPADWLGVLIGSDTADVLHRGGTSAATPMVAGAAAFLLAVEPRLTPPQLVQLLTAEPFAVPQDGGASSTSTRIDLYNALWGIDQIYPDRERPVRRLLADFDDGTNDGFRRIIYDDTGAAMGVELADARGDGRVDLRDFRRLRDAYILYQTNGTLDADPDHVKLDLNFDGQIEEPSSEHFPRVGLAGATVLSPEGGVLLGEQKTDVEVFATAYQVDTVQSFAASELQHLMSSADLLIRASDAIAVLGATAIEIEIVGSDANFVQNHSALSGLRIGTEEVVLTTPFLTNPQIRFWPICGSSRHAEAITQGAGGDLSPGLDRVVVLNAESHLGCDNDSRWTVKFTEEFADSRDLGCSNVEYQTDTAWRYNAIAETFTETIATTALSGTCNGEQYPRSSITVTVRDCEANTYMTTETRDDELGYRMSETSGSGPCYPHQEPTEIPGSEITPGVTTSFGVRAACISSGGSVVFAQYDGDQYEWTTTTTYSTRRSTYECVNCREPRVDPYCSCGAESINCTSCRGCFGFSDDYTCSFEFVFNPYVPFNSTGPLITDVPNIIVTCVRDT